MRKILTVALCTFAFAAAGCRDESPSERAERSLRNAGDDIEDAAEEIEDVFDD